MRRRICLCAGLGPAGPAGGPHYAGGVDRQTPEPFAVRDVRAHMPELAYTAVMTSLRRLANKGLLVAGVTGGKRAYNYRAAGSPEAFLTAASQREAQQVLDCCGDAALVVFAACLGALTAKQRRRLEELGAR